MNVRVVGAPGLEDFEAKWMGDCPRVDDRGVLSVVWDEWTDEYFVVPKSCTEGIWA